MDFMESKVNSLEEAYFNKWLIAANLFSTKPASANSALYI